MSDADIQEKILALLTENQGVEFSSFAISGRTEIPKESVMEMIGYLVDSGKIQCQNQRYIVPFDKTAIEIRVEMSKLGWISDDRLTWMGWGDEDKDFGYSIWFERWNWHGERCDKVCFHRSTADLTQIEATVREAAKFAKRAWDEFPDSVPEQLMNDQLRARSIQPQKFRK